MMLKVCHRAALSALKARSSMPITRNFTFACFALLALTAFSGQAFATYAVVYPVGLPCTPPNAPTSPVAAHTFNTIQSAVTASKAGTIIQICPGTYPEQVAIDKNLTIEGVADGTTQDAAVILPPAGGLIVNAADFDNGGFPTAAQVFVEDSALVTISNLTVDGTGMGIAACTPDPVGILFQNASGTVNHVAVRNQALPPADAGCQSGLGIFVQTATNFTSTVIVENSSVHNYNKNGITGNDPGTTLTVTGSYVQGSGPVPNIAGQNGIQLGFGAAGKINNNTVIDNIYFDPSVATVSDILLYDTANNSGITVNTNTVGNSQVPIGLITYFDNPPNYGNGVTVNGNKIFGSSLGTPTPQYTADSIDVCTNGNAITNNTIFNSDESAVHFDASCGNLFGMGTNTGEDNVASGNTMVESQCAGLLDDWAGGGSNSYGTETYFTVPFPVASSAASCPFVAGDADTVRAKAKAARKFSPVR
jgi:hypothetical protein